MTTEKITPIFAEGRIHFGTLSVPRNPDRALEWWSYCDMVGIPSHEFDAAFKWYLHAAKQGVASAQAIIGLMCAGGRDVQYEAALKWYTRAADQGNVTAAERLGIMYRYGRGVPQDKVAALKWYTRAAELGGFSEKFNLAKMCRDGEGVPQDYAAAVMWYTLAAERGFDLAQHDLGWMYCKGLGVPQDLVRGAMWLNIVGASVEGCSVAKDMTPAEIETAKKLATEWDKKNQFENM